MKSYNAQELIEFEEKVCESFKNKEIKAPVHLYYGNEEKMIEIFNQIQDDDWIFCTWRSHYQCLLKGVPPDILLQDIKSGKSIALCYPKYRIFSSAIVGGNIPIANGVALSIKRKELKEQVYCFVGDMSSETGCFHENWKYSYAQDLPITWIIEDNGKSVCTDTRKTWGLTTMTYETPVPSWIPIGNKIIYYQYNSKYPHAGSGERIQF